MPCSLSETMILSNAKADVGNESIIRSLDGVSPSGDKERGMYRWLVRYAVPSARRTFMSTDSVSAAGDKPSVPLTSAFICSTISMSLSFSEAGRRLCRKSMVGTQYSSSLDFPHMQEKLSEM